MVKTGREKFRDAVNEVMKIRSRLLARMIEERPDEYAMKILKQLGGDI